MKAEVVVRKIGSLNGAELETWRQARSDSTCFVSPFYAPRWSELAAAHLGAVQVAVVVRDGESVAFLPYQMTSRDVAGPVGGSLCDYQGWVAVSASTLPEPGDLLRSCGLAALDFDHIPECQHAFAQYVREWELSPVVDLADGFESYSGALAAEGRKVLQKARTARRRLERDLGDLEFTWHDDDPHSLESLIAWKSEQYVRSGVGDVTTRPGVVGLLDDVTASAGEIEGSLATLRCGGRVVAAHLGLRSGTTLHYWLPSYDPAFAAFSPGTVLLSELIHNAHFHGVQRIDLGKGQHPYKLRFANGSVRLGAGSVERWSTTTLVRRARRTARSVEWIRRARTRIGAGTAQNEPTTQRETMP
jgi:CelD/BcsL family acetyltransferase involved in cellulose biosynthesis